MIEVGAELEGRYRVVRLLGEGGMGAVYEAEHTAIGRRVAIKVLHAHVARVADAVKRFAREARAAAEIGHPNIVEVFDTGTHQEQPFLVMELLHGETLADRLARPEPFSQRASCRIIGHVLSALASAHAKGIVHRDLKPENIFLVTGEHRPPVKLLDFGISKFRRSGTTLLQTTQEGIPLGTPAYMAPEQWMGRKDIDGRADVFAVGVMLYELLTGCLPYEGANQGELFLEIVRGTRVPDAPSGLEREIPAALDAVVLRALDRERDARYPSAGEFLEALRPFGADALASAEPPAARAGDDPARTSPPRLRAATTYVPRPRWMRAEMLGAGLVVACALGVGSWWLSRLNGATAAPPSGPPRPAPTPVAAPAAVEAPAVVPAPAPAPVPAPVPVAGSARPATPPTPTPAIAPAAPLSEEPRARAVRATRHHRRSRSTHPTAPGRAGATDVDRLPVSQEFKP